MLVFNKVVLLFDQSGGVILYDEGVLHDQHPVSDSRNRLRRLERGRGRDLLQLIRLLTFWLKCNSQNSSLLTSKRQITHPVLFQPHRKHSGESFQISNLKISLNFSLCSWGRKWKPSYRSRIITCAAGGVTIFHWLLRKNLNDQRLFMAFREAEQFSNSTSVGIHVLVCMCVRR